MRAPTELESGDVYDGEWSTGPYAEPHGHGVLYKQDGGYLACSFINGEAKGKGRLIESSGQVYEGAILNGIKHGKGQ